jgi:hypothetical protein
VALAEEEDKRRGQKRKGGKGKKTPCHRHAT